MPYDPHGTDDDSTEPGTKAGKRRIFKDFDCPSCNANNPYDDGFGAGDEVRCFYCGLEFQVRVGSGGRLDLREL